jgi:hypothetical protein
MGGANLQDGEIEGFDMRILVLMIIGLLVAGNAAADRDRDRERGGYHDRGSYSEMKRGWRKSARRYASSRLNYLRTSSLNSGVCDALDGSSRGLQMMCIAFCELQSCTPDFSADNPFESCSRSSKWIYNRYEKKRGAGDPEMPCVKQPVAETAVAAACPCWSSDELANFRYPLSGDRAATCTVDGGNGTTQQNVDNLQISDGAGAYTLSLSSFGSLNNAPTCVAYDACTDGACLGETRMLEASPEQLLACEADIAFAAEARGIACN